MRLRSIRNGWSPSTASWSPSGSPRSECSDHGLLPNRPSVRSSTMSWYYREPTLDEMLSDSIVRAVMEADGVDPQKLAATLRRTGRKLIRARASVGIAVHSSAPRKRNLISADSHFLFHRPPHSVHRKPLDEAACRFGGPPSSDQLRKKWKAGQGKQHVDQIAQRFRAQLADLGHAANENGQ